MVETFSPGKTPTVNTAGDYTPRVIRANFGDGYSQRAGDGLNKLLFKGTLVFDLLTAAEYADIHTFLVERGGTEAFYYTLPLESAQKKIIASSWTPNYGEALHSISIKIEEVPDII